MFTLLISRFRLIPVLILYQEPHFLILILSIVRNPHTLKKKKRVNLIMNLNIVSHSFQSYGKAG